MSKWSSKYWHFLAKTDVHESDIPDVYRNLRCRVRFFPDGKIYWCLDVRKTLPKNLVFLTDLIYNETDNFRKVVIRHIW